MMCVEYQATLMELKMMPYMKNKRNLSICMVILPGHTVVVEFNASLQSVIGTTGKHNF